MSEMIYFYRIGNCAVAGQHPRPIHARCPEHLPPKTAVAGLYRVSPDEVRVDHMSKQDFFKEWPK